MQRLVRLEVEEKSWFLDGHCDCRRPDDANSTVIGAMAVAGVQVFVAGVGKGTSRRAGSPGPNLTRASSATEWTLPSARGRSSERPMRPHTESPLQRGQVTWRRLAYREAVPVVLRVIQRVTSRARSQYECALERQVAGSRSQQMSRGLRRFRM